MPIDYPSSPTVNQIYTYNGKAWVFNGTAWVGAGFVGVNASSANTASYVVQRDASGNFSAGTITATLTGNATNVSGIVALANGGTGQITANAAVNALLPAQASNSGKYLTTNGTDSSWGAVVSGTTIPSGSMQMYAGAITQTVSAGTVTTTSPSGWLLANGNAVSRTTYSALFTAIGTTYGTGDGSTTFNLPSMAGRLPMGSGTGLGLNASGTGVTSGTAMTARALGAWFGEETHLLTTTELASHTHANTVSGGSTGNAGSHSHTPSGSIGNVGLGTNNLSVSGGSQWGFTTSATITNTVADHTHTFTPSINNVAAGGGSRHDTIPPVLVMNFIIKT